MGDESDGGSEGGLARRRGTARSTAKPGGSSRRRGGTLAEPGSGPMVLARIELWPPSCDQNGVPHENQVRWTFFGISCWMSKVKSGASSRRRGGMLAEPGSGPMVLARIELWPPSCDQNGVPHENQVPSKVFLCNSETQCPRSSLEAARADGEKRWPSQAAGPWCWRELSCGRPAATRTGFPTRTRCARPSDPQILNLRFTVKPGGSLRRRGGTLAEPGSGPMVLARIELWPPSCDQNCVPHKNQVCIVGLQAYHVQLVWSLCVHQTVASGPMVLARIGLWPPSCDQNGVPHENQARKHPAKPL